MRDPMEQLCEAPVKSWGQRKNSPEQNQTTLYHSYHVRLYQLEHWTASFTRAKSGLYDERRRLTFVPAH